MLWLLVAVLSYLFFSLASLGDKLLLKDKINPKLYVFYVGIFSLSIVILIPFTKFGLPEPSILKWIILEAVVFISGAYYMFRALEKFDASKAIPVIGAIQPILVLVFSFLIWGDEVVVVKNIIAFLILLAGSIIISLEKKPDITLDFLKLVMVSALMFSLDYTFSKLVFLNMDFLAGLIWTRIFIFLFVLTFLFSRSFRLEVFSNKSVLSQNARVLFFSTQASGGLAIFLQSFAISLAPVASLAIVNSLRGIQYVFLFLFTTLLSFFYPQILKEGMSKVVILQKIFSIALIILGLIILSF